MSKINETNSIRDKLASFFFFCRQIQRSHSVINLGLVYYICLAYGRLNHLLSTIWLQEYCKKKKNSLPLQMSTWKQVLLAWNFL